MAAAVACLPSLVSALWRRSESALTHCVPSIVVNCTDRSCQLSDNEETTPMNLVCSVFCKIALADGERRTHVVQSRLRHAPGTGA